MGLQDMGMEVQKADIIGVGSRLDVANHTTLTIGESDLVVSTLASKKKKQPLSSCAPFSSGKASDGKLHLAFYNILWAEFSNGRLVIDYAQPKSKSAHHLERKSYTFEPISNDDAVPEQIHPESFASAVMGRAYGTSIRQKRAFVLVNPHSGPGGAVHRWEKEARPIFEGARMLIDVIVLKAGGEATALAENMDVGKYDTVVACSGDGTPFEIFNGLAKRKDARMALAKIAVSHIPCGSGNAMSNNWNGSNYAGPAALAIVKGHVTALDLSSITQGDRRIVTVLSQALGIMAEADLMTENMRWMGSKRFEVGLMQRVFQKKAYPCDLAVKIEVEGKENIKAHYKKLLDSNGQDKDAQHPMLDGYEEDDKSQGLPRLRYGTINDPVPEGWEMMKLDTVGNFFAGNLPFVAENAGFFPAALPCDGCQDLITIDAKIPAHKAVNALIQCETPKFFDNPNVTYRKVSAYRITPRNQERGCISIDGESIPFEPFQLEVHRGLARVLTKHGKFEAPGPQGWQNAQV